MKKQKTYRQRVSWRIADQQELLTALDERSALASRLRKPRAAPGREPARYQWRCFQKYMAVLEHDAWAD